MILSQRILLIDLVPQHEHWRMSYLVVLQQLSQLIVGLSYSLQVRCIYHEDDRVEGWEVGAPHTSG